MFFSLCGGTTHSRLWPNLDTALCDGEQGEVWEGLSVCRAAFLRLNI